MTLILTAYALGIAWTGGVIKGWHAARSEYLPLGRWVFASLVWPWTIAKGIWRRFS